MVRALLTVSAILLTGTPLAAASYSAKLVTPTTQRFIAPDIIWLCGADACQGSTAESRPIVLCESLAKQAGRVDSFLVDGRAFTAAELGKCNAAAKVQHGKALASQ
jgi:hypothetical protein